MAAIQTDNPSTVFVHGANGSSGPQDAPDVAQDAADVEGEEERRKSLEVKRKAPENEAITLTENRLSSTAFYGLSLWSRAQPLSEQHFLHVRRSP